MIVPYGVTVGGTAVVLGVVPPGPCSVVITNAGTVTMFVGAGTSATTASGAPVPGPGVVSLGQFSSSSTATTLWGITSSSSVTAGLFISTGG